jgi:hypothetical protein
MPALTHGRVKNGFNLLPRTIIYAQGKCNNDAASASQKLAEPTKWQNEAKLCKGSQRALCCGRPLQYTNMGGMSLYRNSRIPTGPANRKFASTVSVGRSFAAKRAIARRTANTTRKIDKKYPDDRSKDTIKKCCLIPTVTYSGPVNAYNNPCSGGLAKNRLLIPCINPTESTVPYQRDNKFLN